MPKKNNSKKTKELVKKSGGIEVDKSAPKKQKPTTTVGVVKTKTIKMSPTDFDTFNKISIQLSETQDGITALALKLREITLAQNELADKYNELSRAQMRILTNTLDAAGADKNISYDIDLNTGELYETGTRS